MKKILLVDDNTLIRAAVRYYLAGRGYVVEASATTADVVEAVRRFHPDAILTNLYSEGYHGVRLPCMLRQQKDLLKNRAVIVFDDDDDEMLEGLKETGLVNGFFRKSNSLDGLADVIESSIKDVNAKTAH